MQIFFENICKVISSGHFAAKFVNTSLRFYTFFKISYLLQWQHVLAGFRWDHGQDVLSIAVAACAGRVQVGSRSAPLWALDCYLALSSAWASEYLWNFINRTPKEPKARDLHLNPIPLMAAHEQ
jgi:hypothetical protein